MVREIGMEKTAAEYLEDVMACERAGQIGLAVKTMGILAQAFPVEREMILVECAKLKFRNWREKEALIDFIGIYRAYAREDIYGLILEAYYSPNEEFFEENFRRNERLLADYPYYRNAAGKCSRFVYPLWQDDESEIYVDT